MKNRIRYEKTSLEDVMTSVRKFPSPSGLETYQVVLNTKDITYKIINTVADTIVCSGFGGALWEVKRLIKGDLIKLGVVMEKETRAKKQSVV